MSENKFDWDEIEYFGRAINGLKVDENRFVFINKFAMLEYLVSNPLNAANPKLRENEKLLEEYNDLHAKI